jgi:gentisate 1,2-dioxygenase
MRSHVHDVRLTGDVEPLLPGAAAKGPSNTAGRWRRPCSWALGYVDHLLLPGSATTPQTHQDIGEFYYVMNGEGTVKVGSETAPIKSGDAVPIMLNQAKSFENTGSAPLELLIVGVVRDVARKYDVIPAPARGFR